jgi:hypothetical protein
MNRRGLGPIFCSLKSRLTPLVYFSSYFTRSITLPTVSGDSNSKTFTFTELRSLLRLKTCELPLMAASPRSMSFRSQKIWLQDFSGITTTFMVLLLTRT